MHMQATELSMAKLLELVANNSRAIITASQAHSMATALVVIGQYDHQYYMTSCVAAECPANMMQSIHATVARDLSLENCKQSFPTKPQVLVAPLNGFGREVFEQSKSLNATFNNTYSDMIGFASNPMVLTAPKGLRGEALTYSVLVIESNYMPPPHEWVHL
jgi:hypothetical protein